MKRNISVLVFIKGGGRERVTLPSRLIAELTSNIVSEGTGVIHLSGGKSLEVTGLLIVGSEFHKEQRVILSGSESN